MPSTVLIVEDDPHALELVRLYLDQDGHQVLVASDGIEGLRLAREAAPDLIVLDLMLPGIDGTEVCRQVRQESNIPIIMVTARVEEEDRLTGLEMGADDYITKPFSPRELAARVRVVLRRTAREQSERTQDELKQGPFTVNIPHGTVHRDSTAIRLTPTEFRLLVLLMGNPGRIFSRELIIDRVFGYDFDGFDRTVDAHVSSLRRKVDSTPGELRFIHTVYGLGYKFGDA
jgi:two-component system alkaline phosphatase synthesis response regulator PhoP